MNRTLLFNPTSLVHDRNIEIFRKGLPGWDMRCVYNLNQPWFSERRPDGKAVFSFTKGRYPTCPAGTFDGVKAVVLFTAQARVPPLSLVENAALRSIPVIAIEEVYMMMLEQGYINNYVLPVDHLFAASEYERGCFLKTGMSPDCVETIGCVFDYGASKNGGMPERDRLKKEYGLSPHKRVATLSLSFLYPGGGETSRVRRELVELLDRGLPRDYELLIKPHPSEEDGRCRSFLKRCSPRAVIADGRTPIEKILSVTDVLFNRGNSQVIIDALRMGIPVIAIPIGRRIFFEGLLDMFIVRSPEDVPRALEALDREGMAPYKCIFERHISIPSQAALAAALDRIVEIAEAGRVSDPAGKLVDMALFWAWMGFTRQALKTISEADTAGVDATVLAKAADLISRKATRDDISFLKKWCRDRYKELVIQSLWISILHARGMKLDAKDREWLKDFPPDVNRLHFLPYAELLYWRYIESDMSGEADAMASELSSEYGALKSVDNLISSRSSFRRGARLNIGYWKTYLRHFLGSFFKDHIWM